MWEKLDILGQCGEVQRQVLINFYCGMEEYLSVQYPITLLKENYVLVIYNTTVMRGLTKENDAEYHIDCPWLCGRTIIFLELGANGVILHRKDYM